MSRSVVYVGAVVNDAIEDAYDLQHYSLAGNNKKRGIVESLERTGTDVTVVSPLWINENSLRYFPGRRVSDETLDCEIRLPAMLDVFGINYVLLAITTTLLTLRTVRSEGASAVVFYNFQLQTAVPALVTRLLLGTDTILEYEDGLFVSHITVQRWVAKITCRLCDLFLDGAICVNGALASMLDTENVTIVRGFPSVGMPDELPEPTFESANTVVMFAGNFDEVRGVYPFVSMASTVVDRREGVEFWISGYGPDSEVERVRQRVESADSDRIRFFGTLPWDQYRDRLVSADILVNSQDPSAPVSPYTFPSKLLDFMSAGAVVVSTDMADLAGAFDEEIVVDGETAGELAQTVLTIDDEGLPAYERYARAGERWVTDECTRDQVGRRVNGVLDRATECD